MHQGSGAPNCKRCKSVAIRKHQGLEKCIRCQEGEGEEEEDDEDDEEVEEDVA